MLCLCLVVCHVHEMKCTYPLPFVQTVEHGFPNQPSALAYDPKLQLMAIGTKSGAIKVYPFQLCVEY